MITPELYKYYKFVDDYSAFEFEGILLDVIFAPSLLKQRTAHRKGAILTTQDMNIPVYLIGSVKKTKGHSVIDPIEMENLKQNTIELSHGRYKPVFLRELTEAERILYGKT